MKHDCFNGLNNHNDNGLVFYKHWLRLMGCQSRSFQRILNIFNGISNFHSTRRASQMNEMSEILNPQTMYPLWPFCSLIYMDLLPDTYNCGLRMRRECRGRSSRHRGLAISTGITARASHYTYTLYVQHWSNWWLYFWGFCRYRWR